MNCRLRPGCRQIRTAVKGPSYVKTVSIWNRFLYALSPISDRLDGIIGLLVQRSLICAGFSSVIVQKVKLSPAVPPFAMPFPSNRQSCTTANLRAGGIGVAVSGERRETDTTRRYST